DVIERSLTLPERLFLGAFLESSPLRIVVVDDVINQAEYGNDVDFDAFAAVSQRRSVGAMNAAGFRIAPQDAVANLILGPQRRILRGIGVRLPIVVLHVNAGFRPTAAQVQD